MNNYKKSNNLFGKIYKQSPGGVLAIRRPYNFVQGKYPIFFDKALGSKITDIDNNTFLDMMCGYGPIVVGHRNKYIDGKVIKQIRHKGNCLTLTQPVQYDLICKLNKIYKTDKAILVKTGSDATTLSIRLARSFTGKNIILRCGYHGWHDWCVGDKFGVPSYVQRDVKEVKFGDLNHLENLVLKYKNKIAALIIWPIHTPLEEKVVFPSKKYLQEVKKICKKNEIVLIFDEIRSGFRVGINGSQSLYNVKPDLTIIGKAMANGYPISAVIGKKEILDQSLSKVYVSSTFFANSVDQVAALSTINFIEKNKVIKKNISKGKKIKAFLQKLVTKQNFSCSYSGEEYFPFISFHEKNENINKRLRYLFYGKLIDSGIFLAPYHHAYIMYSHDMSDIKKYLSKIEEAFFLLDRSI